MTQTQPPEQAPSHSGVTHRLTRVRGWTRTVAEWRNWRLPVKVAAVLAVPAVAAVTLGALQIHGDVSNSNAYARVQQLVALRTELIPLANDVQTERWLAAEKLGTTTQIDIPGYYQLNGQVDKEAETVTGLGRRLLDPNTPVGIRFAGLAGQLAGLPQLQQQALNGGTDVVTVDSNYSDVLHAVLDFDEALSTQLGDPSLTGTATALTDLEVAQEQVRQQQAVVTVAIGRGQILDTELTTLRASEGLMSSRLEDFQVVASPTQLASYQQSPMANAINAREQLAQAVLSNGQTLQDVGGGQGGSLGVAPAAWISASDAAARQMTGIAHELAGELGTRSAALQDAASNAAGIESVVLFAVMLVAITVGVVMGRHLLRSLGILRRTALEVAEHRLPDVVASIDKGNVSDLEIEPVPVHTHEELGQLARAFDAVHGQAVRSAVGQAALRGNLRNIFINLSRRSQSLVERQLRLMEKLERNEEDPQQLANLFRLDHLATRMRRNNENLMVLSGDDPARRSGHPLPLADVLRAAVSEIEQYQRVVVRSTPSVDVLGYASGDLVRLIAELLDNATSFSPPKTHVRIGGQSFGNGSVRIEIRDEGIGMPEAELAEANAKLTASDTADVPVSRQMGLYVVGRLARRHSIRVTLETATDSGGGLTAVVLVPADLVKPGTGPLRAVDAGGDATADTAMLPPVRVNGHPTTAGAGNGAKGGTNGHGKPGMVPSFPATGGREFTSFTGQSITDTGPVSLGPSGFTWFDRKGAPAEPPPAQPQSQPQQVAYTEVGLPRRVPRSHAIPSLVPPTTGRHQADPVRPRTDARVEHNRAPEADAPPRRNPSRTRGFLNDYQAGIRRHGRPDDQADNKGEGESR